MVAVVRPAFLEAVEDVFERWELHSAVIGEVTGTGELRCFFEAATVGAVPARLLTNEAPRYDVAQEPRLSASISQPLGDLPTVLRSRPARSRRPIYELYDHLVGSRTVRRPGLDAAVLRLRPSMRGLAVSLQGPAVDAEGPLAVGMGAVFAAARNVACAGGEPIGLTDCLNFGNPEKPGIGWELAQAIE